MTQTTITVSRALTKLKHLKLALASYERQVPPLLGIAIGDEKRVEGYALPYEQVTKIFQSNYDTINNEFNEYLKIRRAVVQSNALTKITFNGEEITLAEALELKARLPQKKAFLTSLRNQLTIATNQIDKKRTDLDNVIDKQTANILADKSETSQAEASQLEEINRRRNTPSLIDVIGIQKIIDKLSAEVVAIEVELDATINESNVRTDIMY